MVSKNEIKFIKSLKVKKYRVREQCFLVEGTKNVLELVNSEFTTQVVLGTSQFFDENEIPKGIRCELVDEKQLNEISSLQHLNSCVAISEMRQHSVDSIDFDKPIFILDGVNDPGNLGTIIRTLDWFGFDQVICLPGTAEFFNPKVIVSTMGSFARAKVVYEEFSNVAEYFKGPIYGAEMSGKSIFETNFSKMSVIVMGSESHGLSDAVKVSLNQSIHIPQFGNAESLNVGVATGIIAAQLRIS